MNQCPSNRTVSPSSLLRGARVFSPDASSVAACSDIESQQMYTQQRRKRMCIVCRFEKRPDTISTVFCTKHNVCLCKRTYLSTNGFGCQQTEWTCWEKFHYYYLPRGVFTSSGCVVRKTADYQEKQLWMEFQARNENDTTADGATVTEEHDLKRTESGTQRSLSFADSAPSLLSPAPSTPGSALSHDYV